MYSRLESSTSWFILSSRREVITYCILGRRRAGWPRRHGGRLLAVGLSTCCRGVRAGEDGGPGLQAGLVLGGFRGGPGQVGALRVRRHGVPGGGGEGEDGDGDLRCGEGLVEPLLPLSPFLPLQRPERRMTEMVSPGEPGDQGAHRDHSPRYSSICLNIPQYASIFMFYCPECHRNHWPRLGKIQDSSLPTLP